MKTGIQNLLTVVFVFMAISSFGQTEPVKSNQNQKLIINGEIKKKQTVPAKRQKVSPKVNSKHIVKSRQLEAVPAKEK